jgi:hypothetical protein
VIIPGVFAYAAELFSISASGPVMNIGLGVIPVWPLSESAAKLDGD